MMRLSTIACIGLFAVSTASYGYSMMVVNNNLDTSVPEISVPTDTISISIKDDESAILNGVTARDSRDGDVTDSLVVESMTNFIEPGVRRANIVAFDSANHISRETREVIYTDYTAPRFTLEEPLRFPNNKYEFTGLLRAMDCLDGDITGKIHIYFNQTYDRNMEELSVTYSVSNSVGDMVSIPVTITRYDTTTDYLKPDIVLTDYLIYAKADQVIDPMEYLSEVDMLGKTYKKRAGKLTRTGMRPDADPEYLNEGEYLTITKSAPVNGVYEIAYTVTDIRDEEDEADDTTNTVRLIVITEE